MASPALTDKQLAWLNINLQARISRELCFEIINSTAGSDFVIRAKNKNDGLITIRSIYDILNVGAVLKLIYADRTEISLSDISALIFEMLSRAEEVESSHLDNHGRFPASASSAFQAGVVERPVVDECFEVIRQLVSRQWPRLKLTHYSPKTFVTCDVDIPYEFYASNYKALIKKLSGDLIKRNKLIELNRTCKNYLGTAKGNYSFDPNNTFDWMMDVNEKAGNRVAFYFLVDKSVPEFDAHYSIDEPRIRALMRRIHDRGHEIGLHASYGTYKNPAQIKKEADKLRQVMDEEGIKQDEIGSRQHYLRWATPETARHLEAAGIAYDTTLGYADHAGFRCGTCHEYPMFDDERQQILNLRQRPLILMEASVLSQRYMNMGYTDATLDYMKRLKATCHEHGGTFTLLWHNSHLRTENDRRFYQELIA